MATLARGLIEQERGATLPIPGPGGPSDCPRVRCGLREPAVAVGAHFLRAWRPTAFIEPRGALTEPGREPTFLPNPPPLQPLVGRRRRATVTFGPEWLRVARTACSPRGLGTSLVTAWP